MVYRRTEKRRTLLSRRPRVGLVVLLLLCLSMLRSPAALRAAPRDTLPAGWNIVQVKPGVATPVPVYVWNFAKGAYDSLPAGALVFGPCWAFLGAASDFPLIEDSATVTIAVEAPPGTWVMLYNPTTQTVPVVGADAVYAYSPTAGYGALSDALPARTGGWARIGREGRLRFANP